MKELPKLLLPLLLAAVAFTQELQQKKWLPRFTGCRYRFEEFLLRYRRFINLVRRNYRSITRGLGAVLLMYHTMLEGIEAGQTDEEIVQNLNQKPELRFLRDITEEDIKYGQEFHSRNKISIIFA